MLDYLDKAARAYYDGQPFLTDAEFDFLEDKFGNSAVGSSSGDIKHYERMYSLQKKYTDEEYDKSSKYVQTPKLDGAAVSLLYVNGNLEEALTRGDGIYGKDVTEKLKLLAPVSTKLKDIVQITGEVVARKEIKNSRNYAAGSLGLKNIDEFAEREKDLDFVVYGTSTAFGVTYAGDLHYLSCEGFWTVASDIIKEKYPTDGVVYRLNKNEDYNALGHTNKHPRGAFALKDRTEIATVTTTLRDVTWQVGASGKVTPVGHFDKIVIEDAEITKATLHNAGYLEALELRENDKILVTRAGGIIPRILSKA